MNPERRWAEGLRSCLHRLVIPVMSNKEVVSDLLTRLPDDVSLQQIAREVEFVAGVREGMDQLERGEGVAVEKVEKLIEAKVHGRDVVAPVEEEPADVLNLMDALKKSIRIREEPQHAARKRPKRKSA